MPIEIRELVIKATVTQEAGNERGGTPSSSNNGSPGEDIIKICVEKVLEILKEKNER
jgi:hypothetical protein